MARDAPLRGSGKVASRYRSLSSDASDDHDAARDARNGRRNSCRIDAGSGGRCVRRASFPARRKTCSGAAYCKRLIRGLPPSACLPFQARGTVARHGRRVRAYRDVSRRCPPSCRGPRLPHRPAAPRASRQCYERTIRLSTSCATTPGSASVEMSPSASCSLAAILRRMRRMILPERVFGSPGAHWM